MALQPIAPRCNTATHQELERAKYLLQNLTTIPETWLSEWIPESETKYLKLSFQMALWKQIQKNYS